MIYEYSWCRAWFFAWCLAIYSSALSRERRSDVLKILRWIVMLPAALACGFLAYFIGGFINNLSLTYFFGGPLSGFPKIAADVMAHTYLGGAFTYSAVRIAPSAPRRVAVFAMVLMVVFAGPSLWLSFAIGDFILCQLSAVFSLAALLRCWDFCR